MYHNITDLDSNIEICHCGNPTKEHWRGKNCDCQLDGLLKIGNLMANVCFNLGQECSRLRKYPELIDAADTMKQLVDEWDNLIRNIKF